jgi:uncharacterized protein
MCKENGKAMIQVKVAQMFLSNMGFVVLLKGVTDTRTLPIFIGASEAQAIAICINKVEVPRPMTHDLIKNMFDCMECRLHSVEICDLREGTFYAKLMMESNGMHFTIDSRPSDAIAIAMRVDAPVFVALKVMEEAGRVLADKQETRSIGDAMEREEAPARPPLSKPESRLEKLTKALEKAVGDERYEDAAHIRDEISRVRHKHVKN